jgi:hypothetical protein
MLLLVDQLPQQRYAKGLFLLFRKQNGGPLSLFGKQNILVMARKANKRI